MAVKFFIGYGIASEIERRKAGRCRFRNQDPKDRIVHAVKRRVRIGLASYNRFSQIDPERKITQPVKLRCDREVCVVELKN